MNKLNAVEPFQWHCASPDRNIRFTRSCTLQVCQEERNVQVPFKFASTFHYEYRNCWLGIAYGGKAIINIEFLYVETRAGIQKGHRFPFPRT